MTPDELLRRLQEADVTTRHLRDLHDTKHSLREKGEKPIHGSMVEAILLWWEGGVRDEVLAAHTATPAHKHECSTDHWRHDDEPEAPCVCACGATFKAGAWHGAATPPAGEGRDG